MKSIFQRSVFLLLAAAAGSLLVACNNEDPYGGDIKGPEQYAPTTDPLDPETVSTQIALYIDKPIKNLAYECVNPNDSVVRSRMEYLSELSVSNLEGYGLATQVPVARCGNEALSISFYLGERSPTNTRGFIYLGTAVLPTVSAIGSDNRPRFGLKPDGTGYETSTSPFFFSFSVADLQRPPSRIDVTQAFNQSGTCGQNQEDACQIALKTALILAVDSNANDPNAQTIDIAQAVNDKVGSVQWDAEKVEQSFKTQSYNDFIGNGLIGWEVFVKSIDQDYGFYPDIAEVTKRIQAGASRMRAGTYGFNYMSEQLPVYNAYYPQSAQLKQWNVDKALFNLNMQVYPDGQVTGFGIAAEKFCTNTSTNDLGQALLDAISCALFDLKEQNFIVIGAPASNNKPTIQNDLTLKDVTVHSLGGTSVSNKVNVDLVGRFFTQRVYDGRSPEAVSDSDFLLEYPTALYTQKTNEKGSVLGQFFDFNFPYFVNDAIGTVPGTVPGSIEPAPFPLTIEKQSNVQIGLNANVLAQLQNSYYRIELMNLCEYGQSPQTDPNCSAVPEHEISIEDEAAPVSLNYPATTCLALAADPSECGTELKTEEVGETPRPVFVNTTNAATYVDVKFVPDANNDIMLELYDTNSCTAITDNNGDTVRVGYVVATFDSSAVISILFATNNYYWLDSMPNLGIETLGRIDLTEASWPMYRAGDDNYNDKIRAFWGDSLGYQRFKYIKSTAATSLDSLTPEQRGKAFTMSSGAVKGTKLTTTCP